MLLAQIVDPAQAKGFLTEANYTVAGVVLVILAVVAFAVWRTAKWIGKEGIIPLRDRLFIAVDELLSNLGQNTKTMRDISENLQKLATVPDRLDAIEGKVDVLSQRVDSVDEHLNSRRNQS